MAAPSPLLATKLSIPPTRANLIARPHLVERLQAGLQGPLTLICAPPGYGKTTLIAEWRRQAGSNAAVAWISLDADDNALPRFLDYLAAAVVTVEAGLAGQALLLLQAPQPPPAEAFLAALVNDLATFDRQLALVLDDYHLIEALAVHEAIAFLLAHRPAPLHLVILTREDPPLSLPRLRARSEVVEIREGDLRFSAAEAAAFLSQTMGLNLSAQAAASLTERTEGWVAGLQMAALALRSQPGGNDQGAVEEFVAAFSGDDRYVMDYLMEEVFQRQPPETQDFLLSTSVVDRLNAALCASLLAGEPAGLGQPAASVDPKSLVESQARLEALEHGNLFVLPLDNRREWYRYHALFADLLRYRLKREHPGRLPGLHRRACTWYVHGGYADEAMSHALAIPDTALASDVAEQFLIRMTGSSRISTLLHWLKQLPAAEIRRRAYLCAGCGWAYVLAHHVEPVAQYLEAGEQALAHYEPIYSVPDGRWISPEEVRGNLSAIRSYADLLRADHRGAIEHARQALGILPPDALAVRCAVALNLGMLYSERGELDRAQQALVEAVEAARLSGGNAYVATSALRHLGVNAARRGKLSEAARWYEQSLELSSPRAGQPGAVASSGVTHAWVAELHYQRNEVAQAQAHLEQALPVVAAIGAPEAVVWAYLVQALLAQSRASFPQADEWLGRAEALLQQHPLRGRLQTEWLVTRGQLHLAQGDPTAAGRLLSGHGVQAADLAARPEPGSEAWQALMPHLSRYALLGRVLLARGEIERAARLLDRLSELAQTAPEYPIVIDVAIWQALVALRRNDSRDGQAHLHRALQLAAPEGYVRPFLDAGLPLVKLLRQAIVHDVQPAFAQKLLAALAEHERQRAGTPSAGPPEGSPAARLVEPLTTREQQILRFLAAGLSSRDIAEELVISVSTARSYLKTLYQKLGAHSRDEAVDKGQQSGLL